MTAVLTQANKNTAEASVAGAGDTQAICSGNFAGGAKCIITIEADSLRAAQIHEFEEQGSIAFYAKTGTTIKARVEGGNSSTSIDLSIL